MVKEDDMMRRRRGLGGKGATVPMSTRISMQADARIRALAEHIESDDGKPITRSQLIAPATLIGLTRLEEQYGINAVGDCGDTVDSCPCPVDDTRSQLEDNCEEEP